MDDKSLIPRLDNDQPSPLPQSTLATNHDTASREKLPSYRPEVSLNTISVSTLSGKWTLETDCQTNICGLSYSVLQSENKDAAIPELCRFWCNFCQFKCEHQDVFKVHIVESHTFSCHLCDFHSFSQSTIIYHMTEGHETLFDLDGLLLCTLSVDPKQSEDTNAYKDPDTMITEIKSEPDFTKHFEKDTSKNENSNSGSFNDNFMQAFLKVKQEKGLIVASNAEPLHSFAGQVKDVKSEDNNNTSVLSFIRHFSVAYICTSHFIISK